MKEKITASLLITTEDKILIQDNGNKRMKLPGAVKKGQYTIKQTAEQFARKLDKEIKVGGILFVVEEKKPFKGLIFETMVNDTAFVFNTRNQSEFKVRHPYAWLDFDYLDQLDIADELKQLIISNQVIKSSVPLINLH
ncbi:Uncharacterised protein [Macrococcoides caseolyticum]|uniref:hypothetical protein n=1 Tax=Macrococcoides caseolyticum TaxID=69966 RepID=UPI000E07612C|nr:hypothetical protein [Macrococcus caseolyticus]STY75693.1 Uncharacterised protein [Macrococcus caseolyticus]